MRKDASFYFNEQYAYLSSESIHKNGLLFMTPPFIKIKWKELSVDDKYDLIVQVIKASNDINFYQKDIVFDKEIFKAFGFKSWRQFNDNTKCCNIVFNDEKGMFKITPSEYDGDGYSGIKEGIAHIDLSVGKEQFINVFEKVLLLCK